ncbi:hypothetical protein C1645_446978 [Glomus cerebriforme]|uniref:NYN domain-containing protein n=1 Tax=Glomus cerebriforme TaxID=658196 RepID=A0A397SFZ8_9GLOM|nr:hypothetical protein C1645_446978 [Glomus cerebriforme]
MDTGLKDIITALDRLNFTTKDKRAIHSYFTNNATSINVASAFLRSCKKDDEIRDYLKNIISTSGRSVAGQSGLTYIFVDNSTFFFQGGAAIQRLEGLDHNYKYNHITYDHGLLIKTLKGDRKLGINPIIVGSCPLPADSLWKKKEGYDVRVFDKNRDKKEKGADDFLTVMSKVIYQNTPGTLVLVAGVFDYQNTVLEASKLKWKIEIWSWKFGKTGYFNNNVNIFCIPLDQHYKSFAYGYSSNPNNKIKGLDVINGDTIQNESIRELFASNDLFFWFHREDEIIHLYFNAQGKSNKAKNLLNNKYEDLEIWERN